MREYRDNGATWLFKSRRGKTISYDQQSNKRQSAPYQIDNESCIFVSCIMKIGYGSQKSFSPMKNKLASQKKKKKNGRQAKTGIEDVGSKDAAIEPGTQVISWKGYFGIRLSLHRFDPSPHFPSSSLLTHFLWVKWCVFVSIGSITNKTLQTDFYKCFTVYKSKGIFIVRFGNVCCKLKEHYGVVMSVFLSVFVFRSGPPAPEYYCGYPGDLSDYHPETHCDLLWLPPRKPMRLAVRIPWKERTVTSCEDDWNTLRGSWNGPRIPKETR